MQIIMLKYRLAMKKAIKTHKLSIMDLKQNIFMTLLQVKCTLLD